MNARDEAKLMRISQVKAFEDIEKAFRSFDRVAQAETLDRLHAIYRQASHR